MDKKIVLQIDEKLKSDMEKKYAEKIDFSKDMRSTFIFMLFHYEKMFSNRKQTPDVIEKLEKIKKLQPQGNVVEVAFLLNDEMVKTIQRLTATNSDIEEDENLAVLCAVREMAMIHMPDSIRDRISEKNMNGYNYEKTVSNKKRKELGVQLLGATLLREDLMTRGMDITLIADDLAEEYFGNTEDLHGFTDVLCAFSKGDVLVSELMGRNGILSCLTEKEENMLDFVEKQFSMKCCHVVKWEEFENIYRYEFIMCPNNEEELKWSIISGNVCCVLMYSNNPNIGEAHSATICCTGGSFPDGGYKVF